MKRFYCYGKKACCDKCADNQCYTCEFHNGEGGKEVDVPTNYERIRNMSVEELADFLYETSLCCTAKCEKCCFGGNCDCDSAGGIKCWLEKECEQG